MQVYRDKSEVNHFRKVIMQLATPVGIEKKGTSIKYALAER